MFQIIWIALGVEHVQIYRLAQSRIPPPRHTLRCDCKEPNKTSPDTPKNTLYLISWPDGSRNFIAFNLVRKADFYHPRWR
jgi:hypothetical protein